MRAVAIILVVLYHAGFAWLPGGYVGVDVFFVISGYLITSHLARSAAQTGRINFASFYANRFRRLAVPALVVVLATLVYARFWGPPFHLRQHAVDGAFAGVYAINYWLAARGIDYQQGGGPPSAFQHYWSLAVEEQFYLVWPVLVALCLKLGRQRLVRTLTLALIVIVVASLAVSVVVTAQNAPLGYFSLQTRAWELAVGSLIAVLPIDPAKVHRRVAGLACWVGLGAILAGALLFDEGTLFPGYAAVLPVLGSALLVLFGAVAVRSGVRQLMCSRPMTGIGAVSYGWYLWHWPVLTLVPYTVGRPLSVPERVGLVLATLTLAWLSYRCIEEPARNSKAVPRVWLRRGLAAAALGVAASLLVAATGPDLRGDGARDSVPALAAGDPAPAQRAIREALALNEVPENLRPALEAADEDAPVTTGTACHADLQTVEQPDCVFGDRAGRRTVVLFGDSHAEQWLPALDEAGKQRGWRVVNWTKAACGVADIELENSMLKRPYTECTTWREQTRQRIIDLKPDLVLMSQSDSAPTTRVESREWARATADSAVAFQRAGLASTFILDTPRPTSDTPECLAANLEDTDACTTPLLEAWRYGERHELVARELAQAGVPTSEPVDYLCADEKCPPVVGNLLVYRDDSHLSTPYATWLTPYVSSLLP